MSIVEINKRLNDAATEMEMYSQLERKLYESKEQFKQVSQKRLEALEQLTKENKDVEQLKKLSFHSFVATIKNNKAERLEKEELEAFRAKQHYDACFTEEEELEKAIQRMEEKLLRKDASEAAYNRALAEKKAFIHTMDITLHMKLENINAQVNETRQIMVEIVEAKDVAKEVLSYVAEAKESLKSASSYGAWDIIGGGLIASMAKRDCMKDAEKKMNRVSYGIKRLEKELNDVQIQLNLDLQIGSYLKGTDIFFDNIFTDLAVQSKIEDSITELSKLENTVRSLYNELGEDYKGKERLYSKLCYEINEQIIKA